MNAEPVANVDMDGTLVDYDGAMKRDMAKIAAPGEMDNYNPHESGLEYMTAREDLIKRQPGWWRNLEPLRSGELIMAELFRLKFIINILTKGPFYTTAAWTEKADWCRTEYAGNVKVTITEDKGLVYGKVLADDWPDYITRWLEWRPRGFVIMPDQRWNKDFRHPNVFRFRGEDDVVELRERLAVIRASCTP